LKIDKLLAGIFAFIMVTGMVFPAYAGNGPSSELVIKCYPIIDGEIDPPTVQLDDQFGNEVVDPGLPVFVCEIAVKNGIFPPLVPQSGIIYPITGIIDPPSVKLTDQFGNEVVDPTPADLLLVPAQEDGGVFISDHFKFYPISGTIDPPTVSLADKFGTEDADASPATWLAVPVDKNGEGIAINQHYKCYPFSGEINPSFDILADQFGLHFVDPMEPGFYCTQADKDEVPPVVGGEILPIDATSLLLANAQSFSWMIPLVLSGIGIGLFVVSRKSENS